jgi:sugar lactone lactonase YvrE
MNRPKCLKPLAPTPNRKRTSQGYIAFALFLACLLDVPTPLLAAPGDITTVAGGLGEGPALSIGQEPAGVVVSGFFVYVADSGNNIVRRLDTRTGNEIVVAGNGTAGFSGDGGPATNAEFSAPSGLAVDTTGNLFIADTGNQRIRKVDTAGTIMSVAGNGTAGFGGDGGPATSAQLNRPVRVAVDRGGNLFIADISNDRIRKVDTAGTITTVAGGLAQGPALSIGQVPAGVVVLGFFVYVADSGSHVVRRLDTRTGSEIVVAGNGIAGFNGDGGPATSAQLNNPAGLAVDPAGNLLIADTNNQRVRKVDTAGTITTVAGNGTNGFSGDGGLATSGELRGPSGVAVDTAGNLFIADQQNGRIRKVDTAGIITTVAGGGSPPDGLGDGGPATSAQLNGPVRVAVDPAGHLFVADAGNNRIRMVDPAGMIATVAGGLAQGPALSIGQMPVGVVVSGFFVYVADFSRYVVRRIDTRTGNEIVVAGNGTFGFSGDGGPATSAQLGFWLGVAADSAGNLFIADRDNQRIRKVDTAGTITTVAGTGAGGFSGDGGPATDAQLSAPSGVAVDAAGNLFIADISNDRIRKVDTAGTITTVAGNGTWGFSGDGGPATNAELNGPQGVTVDPAGNLFIADSWNNRIRKVDTAGTITTVAGTGGGGPVVPTPASWSDNQANTTVAGNGDGGPATSAQLFNPSGVTVDLAGNLFIADTGNSRIRKVDTTGTITTVAGTGTNGFSGDGGPATSAQLSTPLGVAVDPASNLFIADSWNNRIRKVDTAGTITTVAGNGTGGFSGDGGPATKAEFSGPSDVAVDPAGNLFIADQYNQRIRKVDTTGTITTVAGNGTNGFSGDGGPATGAQLGGPSGVAVDAAGDLFIADTGNNRIRTVDTAGTIATIAGNGIAGSGFAGFSGDGGPATSAQLNDPSGVTVDAAGNLFIVDTNNERIRKIDAAGVIRTVAGGGSPPDGLGDGGPATSARLSLVYEYQNARGVAVDAAGNLFIADFDNQRIRKVNTAGTITTVAGNGASGFSGDGGPATGAQLNGPVGVAVDAAGNLFIADFWNYRIREVDITGTITTIAGTGDCCGFSGDGGPATNAQLSAPSGVTVDAAGNLFIADTGNNRIRTVDPAGTIATVAGSGIGGFSGDGGPATDAQLNVPLGVTVDLAGNLFIADTGNQRIRKVDAVGTIITVAGNGTVHCSGWPGGCQGGFSGDGGPATSAELNYPSDVALDPAGNLFIADQYNQRIRKVDAAGIITTVAGGGSPTDGLGDGGPATSAQLRGPTGVAVDPAGSLFIADTWNNRIRKVDAAGTITTVAGGGSPPDGLGDGGPATSAQLFIPSGVTVDLAGNLFIADQYNQRIRKVDTAGTITTVAGTGTWGFSGDGGPATSAQLSAPSDVTVDPAGNLFIADTGNNRIRMVQPPPTPTPTNTPPPTVTGTPPTATPSPPPSPTATMHCGGAPACVGDCNADGAVAVNELITMVDIALGNMPIAACLAGDSNGDCLIAIDEIITAVNKALNGCSGG